MSVWLIAALIWGVGTLVTFRLEARRLVTRKNYRRDRAIREARNEAPFWFIMVLAVIAEGAWEIGKRLMLAGIPESRADRDEAIKRLEDEVLGASAQDARDEAAGQLHLSLQEALNGTTADEDGDIPGGPRDAEFLDWLERMRVTCGPDTRLPSGKTLTSIRPAYLPRSYRDDYRSPITRRTPDRRESQLTGAKHEAKDQEAAYEAVTRARRALELLRRLSAMGAAKDPATGQSIHDAIRQARNVLRDAEAGHLNSQVVKATKAQVSRLERAVKAQELVKDDDTATVCSRCGCPVVPGRIGYVHIPDLGMPSPCDRATIAPVPWYLTPEDSPEREEVRRRTEERLRQADEDRATAATMRELQEEFPVPLEPDVIRSISLDGTETEIQINRLQAEGYTITYLTGNEPPPWNGMVSKRVRQTNERITEWFEDSTLPVTRKIHREQHADAPNTVCPFCNLEALS
jgi:hypothetical protein